MSPLGANDRVIHSGHSLMDYYLGGSEWPGTLAILTEEEMGTINGWDAHIKSTVPGTPIELRWRDHDKDILDFSNYDGLIITEVSPLYRITNRFDDFGIVGTMKNVCTYAANMIESSRSNNPYVALWATWASTDLDIEAGTGSWSDWEGFNFYTSLDEYLKIYKYVADYVTWKMHQLYPNLDPDWRVWVIPGSLYIKRLMDDYNNNLIPGITEWIGPNGIFGDDIHPNAVAGYGTNILQLTALYHLDLRNRNDLYLQGQIVDDYHQMTFPAVTREQSEYFADIAWDIISSYGPAGMGGSEGNTLFWDPNIETDPLPSYVPHINFKNETPIEGYDRLKSFQPNTSDILLGGHSSLIPVTDWSTFNNLWQGGKTNVFGQESYEVYEAYIQTPRNYDVGIFSELDMHGDSGYGVYPDPRTEAGKERLQALYWMGLDAKRQGAAFYLYDSPDPTSVIDKHGEKYKTLNYYRYWLEDKLDIEVYIVPVSRFIENARNNLELLENEIYTDGVHFTNDLLEVVGCLIYKFVTGLEADNVSSGLEYLVNEAYSTLNETAWAGFGGSIWADMIDIEEDPLPNPVPFVGSSNVITWTPYMYRGPEVSGNRITTNSNANLISIDRSYIPWNNDGFYFIGKIKHHNMGATIFVSPEEYNAGLDPYGGMVFDNDQYGFEVYDNSHGGRTAIGSIVEDEWYIVEGWVVGTSIGGSIDGIEVTVSKDEPFPDYSTPGDILSLIGFEFTSLVFMNEIPDSTKRGELYSWLETVNEKEVVDDGTGTVDADVVLEWSADNYTGPARQNDGNYTVEDGIIKFDNLSAPAMRVDLPIIGSRYLVAAIRQKTVVDTGETSLIMFSEWDSWWGDDAMSIFTSSYQEYFGINIMHSEGRFQQKQVTDNEWHLVEMFIDDDGYGTLRIDNSTNQTQTASFDMSTFNTNYVYFGGDNWDPTASEFDLAAIRIYDDYPTSPEREDARNWVLSNIPEEV